MTREHGYDDDSCPQGMSRREFIKLAAMAGLLAGCRPARQPEAVPTSAPTDTPSPMPSPVPTTTTPTAAPTATSTVIPTVAPPTDSGKVVRARHAGVWDGDTLVPDAIRRMLAASITALTGLNDAGAAWASLFDPNERIAIKVNTIRTSDFWTHAPLVMAVTECLQEAGVLAEQIVIFDRDIYELENASYPLNQDGPGVRCYGTDGNYTAGWTIMDTDIRLSDILLNCDALINMPILKHHNHSGITFAMKNHFGAFDRPGFFHRPLTGAAMVELNGLPPIRDRTRLVIGDTLTVCPLSRGGWSQAVTGDSILVSFDPVAHDAVGLQVLSEAMVSEGYDPAAALDLAAHWLASAAELGLGIGDLDDIELVEVKLG
ncbi:MAG: DUF362 domain-containing protein [Chloroflexota bacterium]|nr:DUF362 domain-containing protein [Chloroflexota bacterium]